MNIQSLHLVCLLAYAMHRIILIRCDDNSVGVIIAHTIFLFLFFLVRTFNRAPRRYTSLWRNVTRIIINCNRIKRRSQNDFIGRYKYAIRTLRRSFPYALYTPYYSVFCADYYFLLYTPHSFVSRNKIKCRRTAPVVNVAYVKQFSRHQRRREKWNVDPGNIPLVSCSVNIRGRARSEIAF